MSDTSLLKRMLHPKNLLPVEPHYERYKVRLIEHQTADSYLEIHGVPADTIVLDLDKAFANDGLFCGTQGECKRADYILISEEKQRILFIEMKRTHAQENNILLQLKGALCAYEYCQVIAREFFEEANFLAHYQHRFISFKHTGTAGAKRKTKLERHNIKHDAPDRMLKASWVQSIQFNKLAA